LASVCKIEPAGNMFGGQALAAPSRESLLERGLAFRHPEWSTEDVPAFLGIAQD
jgi:hypothetical protein